MKAFFVVNRIVFFLAFFLPFILLPQCNTSKKEKIVVETKNNGSKTINNDKSIDDTIRVNSNSIKEGETSYIVNDNINNFRKFHEFLIQPSANSISGYGLVVLLFYDFEFDWDGIIVVIFLICFVSSLSGVFLLFLKHNHIIQGIISLICLITFVVFVFYLFAIDHISINDILWGLWICLILSISNVILTFAMKRKVTIKN